MALVDTATREPLPRRPLTAAEKAREPRSLGVVAWFDGWAQGHGMPRNGNGDYPRRLTAGEQDEWREGFMTAVRERREQDAMLAEIEAGVRGRTFLPYARTTNRTTTTTDTTSGDPR